MWSAKACFRFVLWKLASTVLVGTEHCSVPTCPRQKGETKGSPSKAVASYRTPKERKIHTLIERFGTIIYENLLCRSNFQKFSISFSNL